MSGCKRCLIVGLLNLAICGIAIGAEATKHECRDVLRFEASSSLSIDYLGWLATPVSASSSLGGVIFWPFDQESRSVHGSWIAFGVALANTGDIGAASVGGLVWVRKDWKGSVAYKATGEAAASISFSPTLGDRSCGGSIRFEIKSDHVVAFDGRVVGHVR